MGELASGKGVAVVCEDGSIGLNAALSLGATEALRQGAARVLFIPADLPLARAEEIGEILSASSRSDCRGPIIVPARDGDGTNALLLCPPDALEPSFGQGSFARHCTQARARGLTPLLLRLEGLALDIDGPGDLGLLIERIRGRPRYAFLGEARRAQEAAAGQSMGATEP